MRLVLLESLLRNNLLHAIDDTRVRTDVQTRGLNEGALALAREELNEPSAKRLAPGQFGVRRGDFLH